MQYGEVIGHQVFVREHLEQYVIFASLSRLNDYIEMAKTNLAERERQGRNDCQITPD